MRAAGAAGRAVQGARLFIRSAGAAGDTARSFFKALPWFLRLVAASRLSRVEQIADALRPLLQQTFDAYAPLVQNAGVTDLIRQTGYVVAYTNSISLDT